MPYLDPAKSNLRRSPLIFPGRRKTFLPTSVICRYDSSCLAFSSAQSYFCVSRILISSCILLFRTVWKFVEGIYLKRYSPMSTGLAVLLHYEIEWQRTVKYLTTLNGTGYFLEFSEYLGHFWFASKLISYASLRRISIIFLDDYFGRKI